MLSMKTSQPKPNFCQTASAFLIHEGKILLIKHKKLGVWMAPGGHLDPGELPHQAAVREFWEETGVKVRAIDSYDPESKLVRGENENFLPSSFKSGLHWVCKENYERRLRGEEPLKKWKRGCEKHFDLGFLVEPIGSLKYKQNVEETDGIAWFGPEEIEELETYGDIQTSIKKAFEIVIS
jgi:8-oxo-dGTP pyrophosphatase MutT (NUDIX family)